MKRILKIIVLVCLGYFLYIFIFGVMILQFFQPNIKDTEYSIEKFFSDRTTNDRVTLIEERQEAFIARIDMIENAEETLSFTSHTIHSGFYTDILIGAIIEAADRGVHVQILLDGMFHNLRGGMRGVQFAFFSHPNIELKFYEPFNLLQPWTWNNRFHDKIMIADQNIAMIGGRNIGAKYFAENSYKNVAEDRDVVIINSEQSNDSAILQLSSYFDSVWNHQFSKHPNRNLNVIQQWRGEKKTEQLEKNLYAVKETHPHYFSNSINWIEKSFPTNKITLISNPIERFKKEPTVWRYIARLMENANKSILIQSPYVIPTNEMLAFLNKEELTAKEKIISTNSLSSTPNILAFSGYVNNREALHDFGLNIYEYKGPESIHGKTYIIDQRLTVIGSFNFDHRSSFLSTETMVVIDSEPLALEIENQIIKNHLSNSHHFRGNFNNIDKNSDVSPLKRIVVSVLSRIIRPFEYML